MYKLLKNSLGVTDSSYTNTRAKLSLEVGRVVSHWGRVVLGRVVCPPVLALSRRSLYFVAFQHGQDYSQSSSANKVTFANICRALTSLLCELGNQCQYSQSSDVRSSALRIPGMLECTH